MRFRPILAPASERPLPQAGLLLLIGWLPGIQSPLPSVLVSLQSGPVPSPSRLLSHSRVYSLPGTVFVLTASLITDLLGEALGPIPESILAGIAS